MKAATLSPAEVRLLVKGDTAVFADTPIYAALLADPPKAPVRDKAGRFAKKGKRK